MADSNSSNRDGSRGGSRGGSRDGSRGGKRSYRPGNIDQDRDRSRSDNNNRGRDSNNRSRNNKNNDNDNNNSNRGRDNNNRSRNNNNNNTNYRSDNICHQWQTNGTCRFGSSCRFTHTPSTNQDPFPYSSLMNNNETSNDTTPQASHDVSNFLQRVTRTVSTSRSTIPLDNPRDLDLWNSAWSAVSLGACPSHAPSLLRMYIRLPAAAAFHPPPHTVWGLIHLLITATTNNTNVNNNVQALLALVQLVADVIEHRLLPRPTYVSCLDSVMELRTKFPSLLAPAMTTRHHVANASILLSRLLNLMERAASAADRCLSSISSTNGSGTGYGRQLTGDTNTTSNIDDGDGEVGDWLGWKQPTVGWLQRASWIDAPHLKSTYSSLKQYVSTVRRTICMLTFYWGAGALFPKCRSRPHNSRPDENSFPCNQPLLIYITSSNESCHRRRADGSKCTRVARWRCPRHGHDHICHRCLNAVQASIAGPPSRHASTDVYDGFVERESLRRDGTVYILGGVKSRKPPDVTANWRTTYRLKCSALVAVVKLAASGEALMPMTRIAWAEIVPVNTSNNSGFGGDKGDHNERAKGRMAVRFLTRADVNALSTQDDAAETGLEVGCRVAVIDLQVFLPEIVPVLSALTDSELMDNLEHIKFSPHLLGSSDNSGDADFNDDDNDAGGYDEADRMIRQALETTEIDIISRLQIAQKETLKIQIAKLAREYTLDGTQLRAFAGALKSSLHCVQGPPGTGKSHLGVVLIKALDLVRTAASCNGVEVGPIIVLSYKNHALDEILMDVLKNTGSQGYGRGWGQEGLIRCGRTEENLLSRYIESNSMREVSAKKELSRRIGSVRNVRRAVRDLRALKSAFGDVGGVSVRTWVPTGRRNRGGDNGGEGGGGHKVTAVGLDVVTTWIVTLLRLHFAVEAVICKEDDQEKDGNEVVDRVVDISSLNSEISFALLDKLVNSISDESTAGRYDDDGHRRTVLIEHDWSSVICDDNAVIRLISALEDGNEHWISTTGSRPHFLLYHFLDGGNPPPRCAANNEDGCVFAANEVGAYCIQAHAASYTVRMIVPNVVMTSSLIVQIIDVTSLILRNIIMWIWTFIVKRCIWNIV